MGENFAPKKKVLVAIHCQEIECFMPRQVGEGFFYFYFLPRYIGYVLSELLLDVYIYNIYISLPSHILNHLNVDCRGGDRILTMCICIGDVHSLFC